MSKDKSTVLAFMITRADTDARRTLLNDTIAEMYETAKYPFDLIVYVNTNDLQTVDLIETMAPEYGFTYRLFMENTGQHIPTNDAIKVADEGGYDYLLRVDDDVKFMTKGWLDKLVKVADKIGPDFIISPLIRGLLNPPPQTDTVEVRGVKLRFLERAIGGICRLHSVDALCDPEYPYTADVRLPMGFGDATGIGEWCREAVEKKGMKRWMVYVEQVRVKHRLGTSKQRDEDMVYHNSHGMFQTIPYIPVWVGEGE